MLERFKEESVSINHHADDNLKERNRKRQEAIRETQETNVEVPKETFINYLKENLNLPDKDKTIEQIEQIDFSRANPRNTKFMNELMFVGESVAEGFLDVFNIEVNKATERYEKQTHIIEQKLENGEERAFIGRFKNGSLKRFTKYYDKTQDLENAIQERAKELQEQKYEQKQEQKQSLSLQRKEEK